MSFKSINEAFNKKYRMNLKESVSDVMEDVEIFLRDYLTDKMTDAESELCQVVSNAIPTYDPDWCAEESNDETFENFSDILHEAVRYEMKVLFANAPMNESATEHPNLSSSKTSISNILLKNKDRIDNSESKEDLIHILEDILRDENNSKSQEVLIRAHQAKNHINLLQYIYNFILSGDNLASIERNTLKNKNYK